MISSDDNGFPVISSRSEPSSEDILIINSQRKRDLINEASYKISPLKDAMDGGYIDDDDIDLLDKWQRYRYELSRVEVENPQWPEMPE